MFQCYILILTSILEISTQLQYHPLSEEYISWINNNQSIWKAGKNFEISEWPHVKNIASGVLRQKFPSNAHGFNNNIFDIVGKVPEYFDARDAWPKCESIRNIRDQSHCGSCWAVSAAATMSDRICIHSGQLLQLYISAEDLLSCCWQCGKGCLGGEIPKAWWYWQTFGIVTGGSYNSSKGCKDYSLPPCAHHINSKYRRSCDDLHLQTPKCVRTCSNPTHNYKKSLTFGDEVYQFLNEKDIQLEILINGPVEGAIDVFDDFFNYKSGIYSKTSKNLIGGHAVKILGWGIENDVPYWLCANTWNSDWGDNGYFKIIRGQNHCGIEDQVFASLPIL